MLEHTFVITAHITYEMQWLICTRCWQYLLSMKRLMYGISVSLGCFFPQTFFFKNRLDFYVNISKWQLVCKSDTIETNSLLIFFVFILSLYIIQVLPIKTGFLLVSFKIWSTKCPTDQWCWLSKIICVLIWKLSIQCNSFMDGHKIYRSKKTTGNE